MEKIKLSIKDWIEREKGNDILIIVVLVLIGFSSFGLGRLSKENINSGIEIEYLNQKIKENLNEEITANAFSSDMSKTVFDIAKVPIISNSMGKSFFASSRGKKYYSLDCSAGKTIKQENRIYFSTKEDAERAGYELSKSCSSE